MIQVVPIWITAHGVRGSHSALGCGYRRSALAEEAVTVAKKEQLSYHGFLAELLLSECDDRDRRSSVRRVKAAGFPATNGSATSGRRVVLTGPHVVVQSWTPEAGSACTVLSQVLQPEHSIRQSAHLVGNAVDGLADGSEHGGV